MKNNDLIQFPTEGGKVMAVMAVMAAMAVTEVTEVMATMTHCWVLRG